MVGGESYTFNRYVINFSIARMLLTACSPRVMRGHPSLGYDLTALVAKMSLASITIQMIVTVDLGDLRATARAIR